MVVTRAPTQSQSALSKLSFRQLQFECRDAGLARAGTADVLRKRLREANHTPSSSAATSTTKTARSSKARAASANVNANTTASKNVTAAPNSNKRQKKCRVVDDLLCPITLELPWDPVTAEDGRVYERSAIEKHIATQNGNLKSPMTNEKMGKRLLPAPQHKSMIESLIEAGVIKGDAVSKWNDLATEKKACDDLLRQANQGNDPSVMEQVALNYELGISGFRKDEKKAFEWYKKAHELDHVPATANLGACLCDGTGVAKNAKQGLMYLSMAAVQGSNYAAYFVGKTFARGLYGLSKDNREAAYWLQKCLGECDYMHLTEGMESDAHRLLNEVLNFT